MSEYIEKNPAKSRPLSPNVKRLMRQSRMSVQNPDVHKAARSFTVRDQMYCHMQGNVFMEAAAMGLEMEAFSPKYMNSQLVGVIDVSLSQAAGMESDELSNMLKLPVLMKSPEIIVETLYWIDEIVEHASNEENKSIALVQAINSETLNFPEALCELQERETPHISYLEYAYWLGYIYRCECLIHEESSRMVYAAFPENLMRMVYHKLVDTESAKSTLADSAFRICEGLDQLLVREIWK